MIRKIVVSILVFVALPGVLPKVFSAEFKALHPVQKDGLFGFIDRFGQFQIEPQFVRVVASEPETVFAEGLARVVDNDLVGYVDTTARFVITPRFPSAGEFSEGMAAARAETGKYGYINKTGDFVIAPAFDGAGRFSNGRAQVVVAGLMGFIDPSGKFVVTPRYRVYSTSSDFAEGMACVEQEGRWGFIDLSGKFVVEPQFSEPSAFHEGLASVRNETGSGLSGYIDRTGRCVIPFRFAKAWRFSSGLARVEVDGGQMAFINLRGEIVFQVKDALWAGDFSEGLVSIRVRSGTGAEKWGYLDETGRVIISPQYDEAQQFFDGVAAVRLGGKHAYIAADGKYIWGPEIGNQAMADKLLGQVTGAERQRLQEVLGQLAADANPQFRTMSKAMQNTYIYGSMLTLLEGNMFAKNVGALRALLHYCADESLCRESPETALYVETQIRRDAAVSLIKLADSMVVPVLVSWADQPLVPFGKRAQPDQSAVRQRQSMAFGALREFFCPTALPSARAIVAGGPAVYDASLWHVASAYAAEMSVPGNEEALAMIMRDEAQNGSVRCAAMASLVILGQESGRSYLLEKYRRYLDTISSTQREWGGTYDTLAQIGDLQLIAELRAQAAREPVGISRNNLNTLLAKMEISAKPLAELRRVAEDETPSNYDHRLHAIHQLSLKGGAAELTYLTARLAVGARYPWSDWNESVSESIQAAIYRLKLRSWNDSSPR